MTVSNSTERASTRVARRIVSDIQERNLRPGAGLDPEHLMVKKEGAARGTVREALRFLELHGIIKVRAGPGGGPVVSVPQIDHLVSALSLQLQFADATVQSILEARRSIYPVLVAQAAENATDDDIAALRASLDRWSDAVGDSDATTQEARQFLELVALASKNLVLGLLVSALDQMSDARIDWDLGQREASLKNSSRILEAIERGDPDKARALSTKMHDAARRYWETNAPEVLNAPVMWMVAG